MNTINEKLNREESDDEFDNDKCNESDVWLKHSMYYAF